MSDDMPGGDTRDQELARLAARVADLERSHRELASANRGLEHANQDHERARRERERVMGEHERVNRELTRDRDEHERVNRELTRDRDQLTRANEQLLRANRELTSANQELARARRELERMVELKTELALVAAHDLRNPMTSLLGYVDLIQREQLAPLPEPLERPVAIVHRSMMWMRRLIDHLATLASLDERPLVRLPGSVADVVRAAAGDVRLFSEQHGRPLELDLATVPVVLIDEPRLRFVIFSLLLAAIKRSEPGERVAVSVSASDDGRAVHICVREPRRPPPALRAALAAAQAEDGGAREQTRADLAAMRLYLAATLVRLHDGVIALDEAAEGAAATLVRVTLPTAR